MNVALSCLRNSWWPLLWCWMTPTVMKIVWNTGTPGHLTQYMPTPVSTHILHLF
ncbi:hypothetical protein E2C01_100219 [Portunus trituberculatus]|uniref:Uncharacterized protein n=1 Tax=Portunus trituberculatus TaxID=210409 RepID=A0A5B7KIV3_PORTR|nr:hypothetical protein [Portunus trituberculatus]